LQLILFIEKMILRIGSFDGTGARSDTATNFSNRNHRWTQMNTDGRESPNPKFEGAARLAGVVVWSLARSRRS
jgi:hypothetical protein